MQQTIHNAIMTSLAGDSLSLCSHWIYDTNRIAELFGSHDTIEAPHLDSYHKTKNKGDFTHYGDQALLLLEHLAQRKSFDFAAFAAAWQEFFSSYKGYVDSASRRTRANLDNGWPPEDAGSPSDELGGAARMAGLLLVCRDESTLLDAAADQTRLTHTDPKVLAAARFIALSSFLTAGGMRPVEAMAEAMHRDFAQPLQAGYDAALAAKDKDSATAILEFGQNCHFEGAFPSVVQVVARHQGDPTGALIASSLAGGDSAARNLCIGMILGADEKAEPIPDQWTTSITALDRVDASMKQLDT